MEISITPAHENNFSIALKTEQGAIVAKHEKITWNEMQKFLKLFRKLSNEAASVAAIN